MKKLFEKIREITQDKKLLAQEAHELLENDAYRKSVEDLKTIYTELWANSHPKDVEQRETAYLMLRLISEFDSQLNLLISDYKADEVKKKAEKTVNII